MSVHLPLRRVTTSKSIGYICQQCRHATLIPRPKRPYTFTQLVTLSDGSSFTHRTTSPQAVYKSTRDTYNAPLWNPSSQKLMNIEEDEAGKLAAFRNKFGRGWDAGIALDGDKLEHEEQLAADAQDESLLDLISGFGQDEHAVKSASGGKLAKIPKKDPGKKK
ncbi:MAG: hypothetical protein M1834_000547 [Cirrosporium novae-zelandiae]|nr:MAG: hypothetical protein M1834_000547 [Cirrosporium novae-zelandiae]